MRLNSFVVGSVFHLKPINEPTLAVRPPANYCGRFSTTGLLRPNNGLSLHRQFVTVGLEEYSVKAEALREQAIFEAATAAIKIGKNSDGIWWADTRCWHDPAAAVAEMRATGGDRQISWHHVEHNLRWHGAMEIDTLDAAAHTIDYYASEYAQYKTRIEEQYRGDQRAAELARLDQLFASRVEEAAEQFAQKVGGFLDSNGVEGESEAIRTGFLETYESRQATYLQFINENPDYAKVKGTEDEWLLNSGDFMGQQLRYALLCEQPEIPAAGGDGYSPDELSAAGALVKELILLQDPSPSSNRCEEELGVELGLAAMKHALLVDHFNLSGGVKSKLDQALNNFITNQISRFSTYIEQQRRDPWVDNKTAYALDYDQQAVLKIIRQMVANLQSDDVNAAFRSDLSMLVLMYKEKTQDVHTGGLARYHAYYSSWVSKNYASDWNRFVQQLAATNNHDLSAYIFKDHMQWMDITA